MASTRLACRARGLDIEVVGDKAGLTGYVTTITERSADGREIVKGRVVESALLVPIDCEPTHKQLEKMPDRVGGIKVVYLSVPSKSIA